MGIFEELERIDGRVPDGLSPSDSGAPATVSAWLWPALMVLWIAQAGFWATVDQPLIAAGAAVAAAASGIAVGRRLERGQLAWGRRAASRRR